MVVGGKISKCSATYLPYRTTQTAVFCLRVFGPRPCKVLTPRTSLDETARDFLTATAPTEPQYLAPALVQQGLQPIMLKRQRSNPSGRVKNFCQGWSRAGQGWRHFGRAFARRSTPPTRPPLPTCSPARLATCWRPESVQSLSRIGGRQYLTTRSHVYATDRAVAQAC